MKSPGLSIVLDEFLMLANESVDYQRAAEVKIILREAVRNLVSLRRRAMMSMDRYHVGVVGLTNVGKTTLLNALLGNEFAPRRNGPCTAAPIEFVFGDSISVTAYYKEGLRRPKWQCDGPIEIHRHLTSLADEENCATSSRISRVVVSLPNPLLANGLVIADTPGFGAVQVGESAGSHEASLKEYLRRDISHVFWVVLAEQGIGNREKRFHDDFFSEVCDDVVVTGCDDWDNNDCIRFRRRFAGFFGNRMPAFHFVSGLQGLLARKSQDQNGLESAGISALENRIRELAVPDGREKTVRAQLVQLTQDIAWWLSEYRDDNGRPLQIWWRPDSWARFKSVSHADSLALTLQDNLEQKNER